MASILHLDSSPRGNRSRSRQLSKEFVKTWLTFHPEDTVVYRDLRESPIPHVTEEWIAADYTPLPEQTKKISQILRFSDDLVDEFLASDLCVFGVPMYNFSIPSGFKAYIDQIVRVGRTFTINNDGFEGLVNNKKVIFITARGDRYSKGSNHQGWDAQEPGLRYAFQFIGVKDIKFIHAEGLDLDSQSREQGLSAAQAEIKQLVGTW